jgi:REP element-mobilizing transposase RayT
MFRGHGGQSIFRDDADRTRFCLLLQYSAEKHKLKVHGFCLMSNHVHLLIQPIAANLASGLHALTFRYAQHFNKKYKQRGYLYQGRYKAVIVQTGVYLARLIRYIHLNPVRANIVKSPETYLWSSHQAYAGQATYVWLCQDLVLHSFGTIITDARERFLHYIQIANAQEKEELLEIRKSLNIGAYGDEVFLESIRTELSEEEAFKQTHFRKDSISLEGIIEMVCLNQNISIEEIKSEKRDKQLVQARAAMAMLTVNLQVSTLSALGRKILRDPTSLAKLVKKAKNDSYIKAICEEISAQLVMKFKSYA